MAKSTGNTAVLEAKIQEALRLRLTLTEICRSAAINRVTLWRWRNGVSNPHSDEINDAVDGINRLIAAQRDEYTLKGGKGDS